MGNELWFLAPQAGAGPDSWRMRAAKRCGKRLCEECIEILGEAAQTELGEYAVHYQLGVCCSGGCRRHARTSVETALAHLRFALSLATASKEPTARARVLGVMGNTWLISDQPAEERLRAAIECYEGAAQIYLQLGNLPAWAREEFNLGNACCELPDTACTHKWQEAISHYRNALRIRTKEADPTGNAATLENLGTAYRELPSGDKAANVHLAIRCYRQALRVYTADSYPVQHARLDNNLGNAYLSLPCVTASAGLKNARRALRHFDAAVQVRRGDRYPFDHAVTQFNRGVAFVRAALADACPRASFENAQRCFEESERYFGLCDRTEQVCRVREQTEWVRACLRRLTESVLSSDGSPCRDRDVAA